MLRKCNELTFLSPGTQPSSSYSHQKGDLSNLFDTNRCPIFKSVFVQTHHGFFFGLYGTLRPVVVLIIFPFVKLVFVCFVFLFDFDHSKNFVWCGRTWNSFWSECECQLRARPYHAAVPDLSKPCSCAGMGAKSPEPGSKILMPTSQILREQLKQISLVFHATV